jgi:hypothetical protein
MEGQLVAAAPAAPSAPTQADVRLAVDTKPNDATRVMFDFNKHALAQAMLPLGLTSVVVTYSGCGDEGQIEETSFQPPEISEDLQLVVGAQMRYRSDDERGCVGSELVFCEMHLRDAAEALCETAVTLMHDGYQNDDSGQGTFTLEAVDATAELEHWDFYTESDVTTHAL